MVHVWYIKQFVCRVFGFNIQGALLFFATGSSYLLLSTISKMYLFILLLFLQHPVLFCRPVWDFFFKETLFSYETDNDLLGPKLALRQSKLVDLMKMTKEVVF